MKLPEFSVRQPVAILMLFLGVFIIGLFSMSRLGIDMFPNIEPPVISIMTNWPGASASDVETEVTKEIENWVSVVNNLDTLTSKSIDNLSLVQCKFDWGTDLDEAGNDIRDALEMAKKELPGDIEQPMLFKFSSATAPILFLTVTGDLTWPRLFHLADKKIADELKRIPGVGGMEIYGGLRRRINIYFDIRKLEGFNLSIEQVNRVLAAENLNIPAGSIKSGLREYFVRIPGRYRTMEEIRDTVIGHEGSRPVYLRDVAAVEDAYKPVDLHGWGDGKEGLVMILQKQTGKNTVDVTRRVKHELDRIRSGLPSDVQVNVVMDNSDNILTSVRNLADTLMWSIFFVVIVTVFFLRRVRTAVIISLIIPFSLIISFILLYLFGYTINLMSLMSLAIASGMVVDNGIVVLENITRHVEHGGRVTTAAVFGTSEMGMAITASTMTTVVIFLPLMFLTGLAGIIFKQLGFVLVATLMASLFTSLSLTPMLSSRWLRPAPGKGSERNGVLGRFYGKTEAWFEWIEEAYSRLLTWALGHKKTVVLLSVCFFMSGLSLIPFLSTSFMPKTDTGDLSIDFRLPEGTRIEESTKVIEEIFHNVDDVIRPEELLHSYAFGGQTERGIGVALGFDEGPNVGNLFFKMAPKTERERSTDEIAAALRKKVEKIPGISKIRVSAQDPVSMALMGSNKPISVEIQGSDLDENVAFARKLRDVLYKMPGLVDVAVTQKDPRPELWVDVDRQKAAALGLNIAAVAGTLRNYFYGKDASEYKDAADSYDIFTRFDEAGKDRLQNLLDAPIFTPDGRKIRLSNLARIVEGEGPIEIERKNRQQVVRVEADLFGRALGDATKEIRETLEGMGLPDGVTVSFGGDVEEQKKAFGELTSLLILGILLVYMIMAALFENLRDPFIIMFSIPFAFTGVIYAFYLTGVSLGLISFMGVIMLMGIVVNNAIILVDYIHLLQKRGYELLDAVTQAGKHRLRPVLMTTLTTLFGMVPLAVSRQVGAEVWNPLGITMIGGLTVSTLVTLVLIPTIYYMFERRKKTGFEGSRGRGVRG